MTSLHIRSRDAMKLIKKWAIEYQIEKKRLNYYRYRVSDEEYLLRYKNSSVEIFDRAFARLSEHEKMLLDHELFIDAFPFWWESLYSRSTYFRLKKQTCIKFFISLFVS